MWSLFSSKMFESFIHSRSIIKFPRFCCLRCYAVLLLVVVKIRANRFPSSSFRNQWTRRESLSRKINISLLCAILFCARHINENPKPIRGVNYEIKNVFSLCLLLCEVSIKPRIVKSDHDAFWLHLPWRFTFLALSHSLMAKLNY